MNICYLIRSFSSQAGTESYVYHMALALAQRGHQIHLVSLTGKGRWNFEGAEDKIRIHPLDLGKDVLERFSRFESIFPVMLWRYGRVIKKHLPAIITHHAIDLVEATDWGMDAWAYLPKRQVPVCVRLHGYPGFKDELDRGILKKWPKNYLCWAIQRRHIRSADLVTGVSKAYTDFVRTAWDIKKKKIQVIPIAINSQIFHPRDLVREDQAILFVGRMEKSKGIEILAQAIPLILKNRPKVRFYFAGEDRPSHDPHQTWSQHLIHHFGQEHIVYLGSLSTPELVRYYQTTTLCVLPSLYEPGGTVAFEAMACGCPVIASRVGGLVEVIADRQTGLLTPPGDATALAAGVLELLHKESLRQEFSQKALESIRQQFDIQSTSQQTEEAYAQAIQDFKTNRRWPGSYSKTLIRSRP
jgi:glycosyltransferase involved in cell wall biosynthesis